jgi:hypothetical protein
LQRYEIVSGSVSTSIDAEGWKAMANRKATLRPSMAVSLLLGALVISGCSAGKPPLGTLSQAELAVQQADKSAASVYAPLEPQIARDQRIAAMGYSKAYPVASNNTEARRQQNRRVEVVMQ